MKRVFYFVVFSVFAASCSSVSDAGTNVKTVEVNTAANKSVVSTTNQSNSEAEVSNNANRVIIQNSAISKDNIRNWEGKKGGSKENMPIVANIKKAATAAPDNSEVMSEMNDNGQPVETRTFKNHRILAKVERIDLDNRNIKVYLKNGKALSLPEGRIEDFLTAPADDIIKAVSIK